MPATLPESSMTDATEPSNTDLVTSDPVVDAVAAVLDAEQAAKDAPLRTDGPTLAEYIAAGYPVESYPPPGYAEREPPPVEADHSAQRVSPFLVGEDTGVPSATAAPADEQHADSGYRPVGGAEIQEYMRAKSMGLQGRPSRAEVLAFIASKGA